MLAFIITYLIFACGLIIFIGTLLEAAYLAAKGSSLIDRWLYKSQRCKITGKF